MIQPFVQIEKRDRLTRAEHARFIEDLDKRIWQNLRGEPIPRGELSGRIAKSIVTPPDADVPDCQTCGVCCNSVLCVQVKQTDLTAPEHYWEITEAGRTGEFTVDRQMRREAETGRCAALAGELGVSVGCSIYEQRPALCRKFDAGSDKCHALRRAYGLDAPLNDFEMSEALMKILLRDEPTENDSMIYASNIAEIGDGVREIEIWAEGNRNLTIHQYDARRETWLESDFVGITLAEAAALIASVKVQEKKIIK